MSVDENLRAVHRRIQVALEKGGRRDKEVKLIAVSKTVGAEVIEEAYRAGQREFGENRVQEWLAKKDRLPESCFWHFIGRLQTNKVKFLDRRISLIHSLDRLALLEALNAEGEKKNHIWRTLLQVNVARDSAKTGFDVLEVADFLERAQHFPFVQVVGLMTIGAAGVPLKETRENFAMLRRLRDSLRQARVPGAETLSELSMGMSQDFEVAIEEGATMVRVGSDIFGRRTEE